MGQLSQRLLEPFSDCRRHRRVYGIVPKHFLSAREFTGIGFRGLLLAKRFLNFLRL
jgi:hypothetical protein